MNRQYIKNDRVTLSNTLLELFYSPLKSNREI